MSAESASARPEAAEGPAPVPRAGLLLLATALAGTLLTNLAGQFVGANLMEIQKGLGVSADDGSWLITAYVMAFLCGVVLATPLIAAFGIRRYFSWSALLFASTALALASAPPVPPAIGLRALQGLAAGGFGPIAFVAVFTIMGGKRLPFGLAILALALVLPTNLGPALSGLVEAWFGWQALFVIQALAGITLACAALLFMPRTAVVASALRRDWTSLLLLALALAATLLALGQGPRREWLESATIAWAIAVAAAAWVAFVLALRRSSMPVLDVRLFARRGFVVPISLYFLFRMGFALTAFLVPQLLLLRHGFTPAETGLLFASAAATQLLVFPFTWWLLGRIDRRLIIAVGLLVFGAGAIVAASATGLPADDQFRLGLMLAGAGQVLFLVPNLVAGGGALQPADGPTASLLFNGVTVGGTNVGIAVAAEFVARWSRHLSPSAESIGNHEAWLTALTDASLLVAVLLAVSAAGTLLIRRQQSAGAPA